MKSLRFQVLAYVFVPVVVLAGVLFWLTSESVESLMERRLEKEIELVARSLRLPVEGALREQDPERLRDALGAVSEIGRVYGAAVYDANGRRVAVAGEVMPGAAEQRQAVELVEAGKELGQYADFAGESVFSYFVPLSVSLTRIDAVLQVLREESDLRVQLERTRRWVLTAMAGALSILLIVLMVGHHVALMRPVRALLDDMRRVELGERSWRARVGSPHELARVSTAMNEMLDAQHRAELEVQGRREAELALERRMRQQEGQAALGRFSAGVAHELGAPLTLIQTDVRRLDAYVDDVEGRRRLQRIGAQLGRTRQLVQQLMNLVREEPGRFEPFDLEATVRRAIEGARPEAESRGIEIELHAAAPRRLPGLEVRVEHAVLNLIRNALQSAESRVHVGIAEEDGCVRISIEDDGPGLDPDLRSAVFEPFRSERPPGQGTGLGLTIVRTVAEIHGGEVRVGRSEALEGCQFDLLLPVSEIE